MTTLKSLEFFTKIFESPIFFVEAMWNLKPQKENEEFIKGEHITKQQLEILKAVEAGEKRISIRSGHGIGKTAVLSWLLLWFLLTRKNSQIPCTAPTSDQMHDVLWKEVSIWLNRMPEEVKKKYDWSNGYVRIVENPESWFARAKTARKESPEALAGIHGDFVLFLIDEASGVPEEIYKTAEGALTDKNAIVIMISNPTRLIGYFYDSYHSDKNNWKTLHFNSEKSPLVDKEYVDRIIEKYGKDSDEYRIRVIGDFPRADAVDEKGYVPLLTESQITISESLDFQNDARMGIDPAGEGKDLTTWGIRDKFHFNIIKEEKISTPLTIANNTNTVFDYYDCVTPERTYCDNFGEGANVALELSKATAGEKIIQGVSFGDEAEESGFVKKRAEMFWRVRQWILSGGAVDSKTAKELLTIRYRSTVGESRIQIMPKDIMRKMGYPSPNRADALALTFYEEEKYKEDSNVTDFMRQRVRELREEKDIHKNYSRKI